jgi:hypothetical protein
MGGHSTVPWTLKDAASCGGAVVAARVVGRACVFGRAAARACGAAASALSARRRPWVPSAAARVNGKMAALRWVCGQDWDDPEILSP